MALAIEADKSDFFRYIHGQNPFLLKLVLYILIDLKKYVNAMMI